MSLAGNNGVSLGVKGLVALSGNVTLFQRVLGILRRNNGTLIGIPDNFANTWVQSNGTDPVDAVGDLVGKIDDRTGSNNATQATTANKPVVSRVPKRLGPELVLELVGL